MMAARASPPGGVAGHPGQKAYKQSVIETLPLLERLILEYAGREGIIQIVNDVDSAQGVPA